MSVMLTSLSSILLMLRTSQQKPKLFGKLEFGNDTQQAFNAFEAEHKLMSIENEIRHEFLYGAFCDLEGGYGSVGRLPQVL
jgi:hypothetical protein